MRIAVVGTGISGMVVAYLLHQNHELTVYEANDYIGGHTHTVDVKTDHASYAVDTGFIVFNENTYPNFIRLLKKLDVPWQPSNMSFSVQVEAIGLEYCPSSLGRFFAQRRNLLRPWFWRMIREIFRFRSSSQKLFESDYALTLGEYLHKSGFSQPFIDYFIVPMGAAIWSADPERFGNIPARFFTQFFYNHGFLKVRNQPQWLTIQGGSREYVQKLTRGYKDRIRLKCPVRSIQRSNDGVEVRTDGQAESFDQVILATHSDQALALLTDPTIKEQEILGNIPYQPNTAILHTDESLLPKHQKVWASWNYYLPRETQGRVSLTYNMNILQSIKAPVEFCVTLNRDTDIDTDTIKERMLYHHPVYTPRSLAAQQHWREISGVNRIHYCGAYWGYGFHEDGVKSALAVAKTFGKTL